MAAGPVDKLVANRLPHMMLLWKTSISPCIGKLFTRCRLFPLSSISCPLRLQDTNAMVDKMQRQLNELQPLLEQKKAAAQKLLEQVGSRALQFPSTSLHFNLANYAHTDLL